MREGKRRLAASLAAVLGALILPCAAAAATIAVNTDADEFATGPAGCAMREAVQAANTNLDFGGCQRQGGGVDDVVTLKGGESYLFTRVGADDINEAGDLDVVGSLTLKTRGRGKATIDAGGLDRVLEVRPGSSLTASAIVFTGGALGPAGRGGGIYSQGRLELKGSSVTANGLQSGLGAGIAAEGSLTKLDRTKVNENLTTATSSSGGGGIAQLAGRLSIRRSTIAGNSSTAGGGLYLTADEDATVTGSTISGNRVIPDQFGGGGVYTYDGMGPSPSIRFVNSTISSNLSDGAGGGINAGGVGVVNVNASTVIANAADFDGDNAGTIGGAGGGVSGGVDYKNSIIVDNGATVDGAEDCYSAFDSGHNLVGLNAGCANPGVGTSNARLGPLTNNGGPTKTHALKGGSPAIGRAGNSSPARDQRGHRRDQNPDSGSFER